LRKFLALQPKLNVLRITTTEKKSNRFSWLMCRFSTEFCENRLSSFCIILLTYLIVITASIEAINDDDDDDDDDDDGDDDKLTNADENIKR